MILVIRVMDYRVIRRWHSVDITFRVSFRITTACTRTWTGMAWHGY